MKRILIYSHDTFGLGNIRRMLEVARHLAAASPEVSVLVITGSPMLHAFRIPPRIDYVKLPCLSRNVQGRYGARSLDMTLAATVRLRANMIKSVIADFEPDLILVDKKPFGVEDELSGALASLPGGAARPQLVLLLRDILDAPESTHRVWRKNGYFDAIASCYQQVLVVGAPEVFDLRREYRFPPLAAAKVRFCGYIAREPGQHPPEAVRRQLGLRPGQPLVLVTPGGGEDGFRLIDTLLAAVAQQDAATLPRVHVVCGPELDPARRARVHAASARLAGISVQDFSDDMMSLMAAADVVLAMGGYNTVCELLTLGRRALLVPRTEPGLEQCIRAERMAALGLVRMLHPARLAPDTLWRALQAELAAVAAGAPAPVLPQRDGLARVTEALLDAVGLQATTAPDATAAAAPLHAAEPARGAPVPAPMPAGLALARLASRSDAPC